ncbi:cyclopropane fatty acyl phospholipid synthase [Gemmatimonadota bacterium]
MGDSMSLNSAKETITILLDQAGISVNGKDPHDIQVINPAFFGRVLGQGSLGLGESYMDGWWESFELDKTMARIVAARDSGRIKLPLPAMLRVGISRLAAISQRRHPYAIGQQHYDKGNDLFKAMLDPLMVYSCGFWRDAKTLDEAQEAKLERVCQKMRLESGMEVLDIGCGWGCFAKYAALKYGVRVHGITVSKEQLRLARQRCAGLPVTLGYQDYREIDRKYDRIVSIGMFEHVGHRNYPTFFNCVRHCLKPGGLFLLHTIGGNRSVSYVDPFIKKHIFQIGMIPSLAQIGKASENGLILEHWENFGPDYDPTLMAWCRNFEAAWPDLKSTRDRPTPYDERFFRMWRYFLLTSAGSYRVRHVQVWQFVYSHGDLLFSYDFRD